MTAGRPPKPTTKVRLPPVTTLKRPDWPFPVPPSPDAQDIWEALWCKPQATAWHGRGHEHSVARYVLILDQILEGSAKGTELSEARQLETLLGLNPQAMLRLGWVIDDEASDGTIETDDEEDWDLAQDYDDDD